MEIKINNLSDSTDNNLTKCANEVCDGIEPIFNKESVNMCGDLFDSGKVFYMNSNEELRIFELLISVSGVGPKSAVGVLSDITPADFSLAVITDDVNRLTKVSGIGKKTAQRIIVELKDKMKNEDAVSSNDAPVIRSVVSSDSEEAIAALQVLGYPNKDAVNMVNAVANEGMSVEEIVKQVILSKKVLEKLKFL